MQYIFKKNLQSRRDFVKNSILLGTAVAIQSPQQNFLNWSFDGLVLHPSKINGLKEFEGENHLNKSTWYAGEKVKDGFFYSFPVGSLADKKYITMDMLAAGNNMIQFNIELQEGEGGSVFQFAFGVLNQCSLRVRLPLELVDQNTWRIPREGAFLKPMCWGNRVDLAKVDRMRFYINRKSEQTSKFCMTPVIATKEEIPVIEHPVLPKGKLLDDLGQSTIHNWEGKTHHVKQMTSYLKKRLKSTNHTFPTSFSKWGGLKDLKVSSGSGFFQTHKYNNRWWLIDPDGYLFWSAGVNSVRVDTSANINLLEDALEFMPPRDGKFADIYTSHTNQLHINYLAANFIRTFGPDWKGKWAKLTLDELVRLRFNTVGNWSSWEYASQAGFPYVIPMSFSPNLTKSVYRDFPDVFHPDFKKDAAEYAETLSSTKNDPALIGYFMMNEPKWAFSHELPAVGMLYNCTYCATKNELIDFLKGKYSSSQQLATQWRMEVSFEMIKQKRWKGEFTHEALADLEGFSEIMVKKYFSTLSQACKKVDPNHLNLGIRYAGVPPKWAISGMNSFDVFSMNNYRDKVPFETTKEIHDLLQMPVIIGEWHFGALDVGLPSSGIGHVRTQKDRGKAYRVYFEDAAANPYCIGVHWFVLYDQSALGRFDGENYNIGFLDICNKPHKPLCAAAIKSHEAVYDIASGKVLPYNDTPEYLPKLFI